VLLLKVILDVLVYVLIFEPLEIFFIHKIALLHLLKLVVHNFYLGGDRTILVCEFQGVRQEVQQNLQNSPLVSVDGLDKLQVDFFIDHGFQFDFSFLSTEVKHLKSFEDKA
jgi:DNA polymerase sigma